ncbi:MAG: J domain-containing protein [Actinomycetia bacterium]|nr:J domain-containing protein [Actinomycetes bacterium]
MDGTTALVELALGPGATASEISRAFRELAKRTHPDLRGSAAAFRRLRRARDVALAQAVPEPTDAPIAPAVDPPPAATGPWLVSPAPSACHFDRHDSLRRPTPGGTERPGPPVGPLHRDRADHNGLRFADHLAHALAS